jgi:CHASE1-domain containing sensor protein
VGVVLTLVAVAITLWSRGNDARAEFDTGTEDAEELILARAEGYGSLLRGLRAYFGTNDFVTRENFSDFVAGESVDLRYPGTEALGFSPVVAAEDVNSFERDIQDDTSVDPEGYPDFEVTTGGDNATLLPVTYLEPLEGNESAFGFDISGDEAGAEAVEAAIETGAVTATRADCS